MCLELRVTMPSGGSLVVLRCCAGTVGAEAVLRGHDAVVCLQAAARHIRLAWLSRVVWRLTRCDTKSRRNSHSYDREHAVICGAQIAITMIVAPLGVISLLPPMRLQSPRKVPACRAMALAMLLSALPDRATVQAVQPCS